MNDLAYELSREGIASLPTIKKYLAGGTVRPSIAARLREALPRVQARIAQDPRPNKAPQKDAPKAA